MVGEECIGYLLYGCVRIFIFLMGILLYRCRRQIMYIIECTIKVDYVLPVPVCVCGIYLIQ